MTRFADRYELGEILGSGGFATVYRARARAGGRDVAIKVIDPANATPELADRFRNEALSLSRLSSPNIARVYDFGKDDVVGLYLVMEVIVGVPLDAVGLGRALDEREVLVVARGLLSALSEAHAHGIIHRDVKPANVIVPNGISGLAALKVLDFGIARAERRSEILLALGTAETREGHMVGTPAYMAPEQVTMDEVGPATDVWSAGLVLFELLDRGALYAGATQREQLVARISTDADITSRVAEPLRGLLLRMLARDPAQRFRNAGEALIALGVAIGPSAHTKGDALARTELTSAPPVPPASRRSLFPSKRPELMRSLTRFDVDVQVAVRQALQTLDLSMLDALARRERGSESGRIVRALALALRIELDAASVVLEPMLSNPLARAIASTIVAPRANAAISKRMDVDMADAWVDEIEPALACLLTSIVVPLAGGERATRGGAACERAYERARGTHDGEMARLGALIAGGMANPATVAEVLPEALKAYDERKPRWRAEDFARCLGIGNVAFRADELVARDHLDRATRVAADAGAALFEARALVSWGAVMLSARAEAGLSALERAATLLAHSDATSLEQMAMQNTGAALMTACRHADAVPYLRRSVTLAREASLLEYEALGSASLAFTCLTLADHSEVAGVLRDLQRIDVKSVSPRARSYMHIVGAMRALRDGDLSTAAEEGRAACDWGKTAGLAGADALLMAEVIDLVIAVARGETVDLLGRAADLDHMARARGFASFFWFDVMTKTFEHIADATLREALLEPTRRIVVILGPQR